MVSNTSENVFIFTKNMKYHSLFLLRCIFKEYLDCKILKFLINKPITLKLMLEKIKKDLYDDMADGYGSIENWNTYIVEDMLELFYGKKDFNRNISNWNVGNIKTMKKMFWGCKGFNQPLEGWNVSNVRDMSLSFVDVFL